MDSGTKRKRRPSLTGVATNTRLYCNEEAFKNNQSGYHYVKPQQEVRQKRKYTRKAHLVKQKQKRINDEEVTAPFPYQGDPSNYPNNFLPASERKLQEDIPDHRYANEEPISGSNSSSPSYAMVNMPVYQRQVLPPPSYDFAEDQYIRKDSSVPEIQPHRSHYNGITLLLYQITEVSLVHLNLYRRDLERSKVIFYKMHNYFMNNYPVLLRNSYDWRNLEPFQRIKQCTNILANHLLTIEPLDTVAELKLRERLHVKFSFYSQNPSFDKAWRQLAITFEDTVTVITRLREKCSEDPSKNQEMSYQFIMTENGPGFEIEELSVKDFYLKYCNNLNYYHPPESINIRPANMQLVNRPTGVQGGYKKAHFHPPNRKEIIRPWMTTQYDTYRTNPCDCREPIPYKEFRNKLDLEKRYIYRSNTNVSPGIIRPWDNTCDMPPNTSGTTADKNFEVPGQVVQEPVSQPFLKPTQSLTTQEELCVFPSEVPQLSEVSVICNPRTNEDIHTGKDAIQINSQEKTNSEMCSINHSKIIRKIISEVSNIGNKNFTTIEEVISEILLTIIECVSFHGEDTSEESGAEKLDDCRIRNNPEMIKVCDQIIKVMTNKAEKKAVRINEVRNILKTILNGHLRRSEESEEASAHKEVPGTSVEDTTATNVEVSTSNNTEDPRQTQTESAKSVICISSSDSAASSNEGPINTAITHHYPKTGNIPNTSAVVQNKNKFQASLKTDNNNMVNLTLQQNTKNRFALIYRNILEDCKKKYKEDITKDIEKLIPTDMLVYDSQRNLLLRFSNPTEYQKWLSDRESNKNTNIIRLHVEPFAFINGDYLNAVQYVREVQSVYKYVPADFAKFYDYLTKSKIVNKYNPITFCKFLRLYNDNVLQNEFKNYIEYLKKSMKAATGPKPDEPVLMQL